MRRDALRAGGIAAAAAALVGVLFVTCFERRTVQTLVGWSREALENPYLASERLLREMGHEVRALAGPHELVVPPPTDGTLLIPVARRTLDDALSEDLLDWAERGGHLVVVSYTLWDASSRQEDPLIDRFGLRQYQHLDEDETAGANDAAADGGAPGEATAGDEAADGGEGDDGEAEVADDPAGGGIALDDGWDDALAWWPGRDGPLTVRFDWRFHLVDVWDRPAWQVSGDWGTHLLTLRHGRGWITAMSDEFFLRNDHIDEADHAEFLVRLARMGGRRGPVWILTRETLPGLWSQAREHATAALVGVAVLVFAGVWRASRRFGPIRPPPAAERRRWLEHLEAVGRYLWRNDAGRSLLEASRTRVKRTLKRRHPQWAQLPAEARAARLAERTGLSADAVSQALDGDFHPTGEAAFVAAVAHLERIRASL